MTAFLELYEPLDVIGNGSFGIIRKVCRKTDGLIFARKELNFERMTERDRKQIVAEVNILKDLHNEHIVRYHDRYVDRDAGILYILMEYCGGGDLSSVIKQAQRHGRPIPEDTIWNYFMQILLALNHCHNPHSTGRTSSGGSGSGEERERRPQILHRDLKPDNVFLTDSNTVKLGDFGLSKALSSSTFFAQTYVGTPYYMSPELMQEKSYDSKSDIWSLGCLIYELCALKPPFHEAKTHAELSVMIRNGRIPPLPKGYSPALGSIIKAMLNLNPAMRPSAQQLLQHERLDLAFKVSETQKMLTTVKTHKASILARERDVAAREASLLSRESQLTTLTTLLATKETELVSLRALLSTAETNHHRKVREALLKREEELRAQVLKHEAEVALRMARREEEIMEAVQKREEEIGCMWARWERETREEMCRAVEERMEWVKVRTEELEREKVEVERMRVEMEERLGRVEEVECESESKRRRSSLGSSRCGRSESYQSLEEVKNLIAPLRFSLSGDSSSEFFNQTPIRPSSSSSTLKQTKQPTFETPINRPEGPSLPEMPSAMKGVILTSTGESLQTPRTHTHTHMYNVADSSEVSRLFEETPRVSLNFAKIFDFEEGESDGESGEGVSEGYETDTRVPVRLLESSPEGVCVGEDGEEDGDGEGEEEDGEECTPKQGGTVRASRLRRPSIVRRLSRDGGGVSASTSTSTSATSTSASTSTSTVGPSMSASTSRAAIRRTTSRVGLTQREKEKEEKRSSRPPSRTGTGTTQTRVVAALPHRVSKQQLRQPDILPVAGGGMAGGGGTGGMVEYDMSDEENLPSPFLKRVERDRLTRTVSVPVHGLTSHTHTHIHAQAQPRNHPHLQERQQEQLGNATARVGGGTGRTVTTRRSGTLRAQAVVNAATTAGKRERVGGRTQSVSAVTIGRTNSRGSGGGGGGGGTRSCIVRSQRASEEVRKALSSRP